MGEWCNKIPDITKKFQNSINNERFIGEMVVVGGDVG